MFNIVHESASSNSTDDCIHSWLSALESIDQRRLNQIVVVLTLLSTFVSGTNADDPTHWKILLVAVSLQETVPKLNKP